MYVTGTFLKFVRLLCVELRKKRMVTMTKLYLTTALISGLLISSIALAQDYDKKNTENLKSKSGFSVLEMDSAIRDNKDTGILNTSPVDSSVVKTPVVVTETIEAVAPLVKETENMPAKIEKKDIIVEEKIIPTDKENIVIDSNVVVETKTIIGNTDTGVTPKDMAKYLDEMD